MDEEPRTSATGVDRSLIRWMLDKTPAERLAVLEEHVRDVLELRELNHALLRGALEERGEG